MNRQAPVFALVAGEASGDILGTGLIQSLKKRYPDARFVGIGGQGMQAEGLESFFPMEELSVMGLVEVLKHLPRLLKIRRELISRLLELQPDVFIGIDAPDFNIGVELKLRRQAIKTVHYVSPSVWAWRPKRIFKIDKATDTVLSLLPFEKAFYDQHGVSCHFVGHPLADTVPLQWSREDARAELGVAEDGQYLAILPGSRGSEVELLTPVFLDAATRLKATNPQLKFLVPLANEHRRAQFEAIRQQVAPGLELITFDGRSREIMAAADGILLASGTATLEAMLVKRPMVVAYKVNAFTLWLARKLVKLKYFSLPNLLADAPLVPELLQEEANGEAIADAVARQLSDPNQALIDTFVALHQELRQDASEQSAAVVAKLIGQH